MARKAALHNLGCKVNAYETEAMQQLLEAAGYEIVPFQETADVYIINTCSVTNVADKKSRQMLHRAKKQNPAAVVVAAGCYVQTAAEELKKDAMVDVIIGNNRKKDLTTILERFFWEKQTSASGEEKAADGDGKEAPEPVIDINRTREYEELSVSRTAEHTRAFLKVQDGCNQFCTYCVIPYARGRVRSRRPEKVEEEVRQLAAAGYREVVLTGIHLSSYGTDFAKEEAQSLLGLIRRIHAIEGIRRIRLGSLEPRIVTEEFARALASMEKICPHFHLSLQSGCDTVLARMNRRYTTQEYRQGCEYLRAAFAHPAITTDVIVGFPGETEEEFAETCAFLEEIGFYKMHIFKYSRRAGTKAAVMPGQIAESVKAARSETLQELESRMSRAFRESRLGCEDEVLLEEPMVLNGETWMVGHTPEYIKVAVSTGAGARNAMVSGVLSHMLTNEIVCLEPQK
ncbi:MAG: tRNA (N(6)-L-threonylcarbamoyladenosine(37)-C(2))-methylthiotransferase MtaB [Clostridiales bacterium]|nr:tRNA (N(6)-L-threonylcarbamoyladenosine(37)-C(2))-methylthiotransferase MtaB [Clostridiales bacterium]